MCTHARRRICEFSCLRTHHLARCSSASITLQGRVVTHADMVGVCGASDCVCAHVPQAGARLGACRWSQAQPWAACVWNVPCKQNVILAMECLLRVGILTEWRQALGEAVSEVRHDDVGRGAEPQQQCVTIPPPRCSMAQSFIYRRCTLIRTESMGVSTDHSAAVPGQPWVVFVVHGVVELGDVLHVVPASKGAHPGCGCAPCFGLAQHSMIGGRYDCTPVPECRSQGLAKQGQPWRVTCWDTYSSGGGT